ncbi:MAG: hypothetical protein ACE5MB_06390 [Anaerolineae bacterium]
MRVAIRYWAMLLHQSLGPVARPPHLHDDPHQALGLGSGHLPQQGLHAGLRHRILGWHHH